MACACSCSGRVLFVVDRHDWAYATVARELGESLAPERAFSTISSSDIAAHPVVAWKRSREVGFLHFLGPYLSVHAWLGAGRRCLFLVPHLEADRDVQRLADMGFHRFIAMSERTAEAVRRAGIHVGHVWRPGAPPEQLGMSGAQTAAALGPTDGSVTVGFSGKGSSDSGGRKGVDVLLTVLTAVSRETPVRLRLCGEGWDRLAGRMRNEGVPVELVRPLSREDALRFYQTIDIYLCTSRLEGGPLPVVEAMASGCCVISTRVGFVPEIVTSGVNGVLCDIDDATALTGALSRLCRDAPLRRALGGAAAAHVRASWYWTHDRERVQEAYAVSATDKPLPYRACLAWLFLRSLYASAAHRIARWRSKD